MKPEAILNELLFLSLSALRELTQLSPLPRGTLVPPFPLSPSSPVPSILVCILRTLLKWPLEWHQGPLDAKWGALCPSSFCSISAARHSDDDPLSKRSLFLVYCGNSGCLLLHQRMSAYLSPSVTFSLVQSSVLISLSFDPLNTTDPLLSLQKSPFGASKPLTLVLQYPNTQLPAPSPLPPELRPQCPKLLLPTSVFVFAPNHGHYASLFPL